MNVNRIVGQQINAMKFEALTCIIYLHRQIEYKVTLFIDSIY